MIVDETADTESDVIANDTLNTLLEADKQIISKRLKGMTQVEIGKELGFSQVHIYRKMKKLKSLVV